MQYHANIKVSLLLFDRGWGGLERRYGVLFSGMAYCVNKY